MTPFAELKTCGTIALTSDSPKVPIKILRDTGASQSLMVRKCLPDVNGKVTGDKVMLRQFDSTLSTADLAKVHLESNEVVGDVKVGLVDALPLNDVNFILGNGLSGGSVVPNVLVRSTPLDISPSPALDKEQPDLFPGRVVTRSQAQAQDYCDEVSNNDLVDFGSQTLSKQNLITAETQDETLRLCRSQAVNSLKDVVKTPGVYYEDGR